MLFTYKACCAQSQKSSIAEIPDVRRRIQVEAQQDINTYIC